ncbi:MAG: DNA mismatch endonuclease Vsr [Spirochaetales bacterium]|nr:DNA mismatch endonuclease Vsr [Spirochaetales bacterium]
MGTSRDRRNPETTIERSLMMSRIRGKDTRIEVYFRKLLFQKGYRYRKNVRKLPGHPDLLFRRFNTVIFINGCFWHRHSGCRYATSPKTHTEFWMAKFAANISRDETNRAKLLREGYKVLVIWECLVKKMMKDRELEQRVIEETLEFMIDSDQDLLVLE